MKNFYQKIRSILTCCSICGEFPTRGKIFCESCSANISRNSKLHFQEIDGFKHIYIFPWRPESKVYNNLVIRVKGGKISVGETLELLWPLICSRALLKELRSYIIIPAPSTSDDHAVLLGKELQKITGARMCNGFIQKKSKGTQKSKSLAERIKLSFVSKYRISGEKILFVDDILTTGSSFRALRECLGKENEYCCISLFFRNLYK